MQEVGAAGLRCGKCGVGACARRHSIWHRKRVIDLSTGDVFEKLPIVRVVFCDGSTRSLLPAETWRGRFTVSSVLETTVRVLGDGIEAAYDWTWLAGSGEEMVSRRSLRRWRDIVRKRVVGSAWAWLGPHLGLTWSDAPDPAAQLDTLLERMTADALAAFRREVGRAVLDKVQPTRSRTRSIRRRIPGRHDPTPSHDLPSFRRPRGAWSRHRRRGPPPADPKEEVDP